MQNGKPYILFCAGEDSGDCIGEALVTHALIAGGGLQKTYGILGAGGPRMQKAGLEPLVAFDTLPVSGFGDVLPRYFKLRRAYKVLEKALVVKECVGLVAVDYPGFNMKLVALAKKLGKPVLYVAPPQIWAWKPQRSKLFAGCANIRLATFFDFEVDAYEQANCNVLKMTHPFASVVATCTPRARKKQIMLLPGSRKSQALRNMPVFLKSVQRVLQDSRYADFDVIVVAARKSLVAALENAISKERNKGRFSREFCNRISVQVSPATPKERCEMYGTAAVSLSSPGTATLELALSNCPTVVCTRPDFLTFVLAKRKVKTRYFALPNLILKRQLFTEYISRKFDLAKVENIANQIKESAAQPRSFSGELQEALISDYDSEKLMSEFLVQLV
ncbi:MAG: lipid-A-disaccharide synthase [Fibrobacter sp.]|nr:lipid-A-disaccharide synthase [Fibrobacter sp.]